MPTPSAPEPTPGAPKINPPGTVSDPDAFGPDAPNVRDDDPKGEPGLTRAPQPSIPVEPLEDDQIAPDES